MCFNRVRHHFEPSLASRYRSLVLSTIVLAESNIPGLHLRHPRFVPGIPTDTPKPRCVRSTTRGPVLRAVLTILSMGYDPQIGSSAIQSVVISVINFSPRCGSHNLAVKPDGLTTCGPAPHYAIRISLPILRPQTPMVARCDFSIDRIY